MHPKFEKLTTKLYHLFTHTHFGLRAGWLVFVLIILLVAQSHLFNLWLNIMPDEYIVRRTASAAALGFLLFGPAMLLRTSRAKYWYLGLTALATALIFVCQYLYYAYSGGFLQPSALFYASQGVTILDTVETLLTYRLLIFVAGPILVLIAWLLARHGKITELHLPKQGKIVMGIVILICVLAGNGYLFLRESMEGGFAYIYEYKRLYNTNRLVSKVGILNFSLGNLVAFGLQADKATAADLDFATSWLEDHQQLPPTATSGKKFGLARGRNLIIIQIESFENAVINEKIGDQEITPHLNRLAAAGLYFPNYYSPIGPGTTADAEFMTLNSLYPLPDKVAFIDYAHNDYTALPALLAQNGYHTYAFHGDVPSFWNRANMYPRLGYEKWFGQKDYTVPRAIGPYDLGDADFFTQSIPKLQALPQPFMATLITLTSHVPYQLPPDLQTLTIPPTSPLSPYHRDYVQSVHYVDAAIGAFIAQLQAAHLYDNSLIAIFGDHGSFTSIGQTLKKNQTPFSELQNSQVPLILLAPGADLHGIISAPGSHLDFYPTIAPLLGFSPPPTIFGQDLLTTKTPLAIHRNLISGTIKNILTDTLAFQAAQDGEFAHGTCLALPDKKILPTDACHALYDKKEDVVRVSDLIIKGNLLSKQKPRD